MCMEKKKKLKYYTYGLDMVYLNVLALVIFFVVGGLVFWLERNDSYVVENTGLLVIYMILWLMLHEVLHGIGFGLFPEVKKKNIVFGMALEKGVFYCMCKQKISKKVILTSLLFPFTFIGVVTLIWGMIINSYVLVFLSITNIAGAVGDLVMTCYFMRVGKDVIYLDLDDSTSFTVLSYDDLSYLKVKGIQLKDSGGYSDDMVAKDGRKIVISKQSFIVLFLMLLFSLYMIFVWR